MADALDKKIGEELRRITKTDQQDSFPVMSGKVVAGSIDEAAYTCAVELRVNDGVETLGVALGAVQMNALGVALYPADNSDVLVAEVDGPGRWAVIRCSTLAQAVITVGSSKIVVKDGEIIMNKGTLDGLPIVGKLAEEYRKIQNEVNQLKRIFGLWTPVSNDGGAALKALLNTTWTRELDLTLQDSIENKKIKQ